MPDNARLTAAALRLRAMAPQEWDAFLMALREYSAGVVTDIMRSPPEVLQRAQGMAIGANEICSILVKAPNQVERLRPAREVNHG